MSLHALPSETVVKSLYFLLNTCVKEAPEYYKFVLNILYVTSVFCGRNPLQHGDAL